ncbi:MAG: MiaB/RimO family radical SAM methylthiotransferase, partial [Planctomycetes bacterium]|nr:MiaB/RimO family radical SAM methylthiotransferase [Planctomycetota bacterium]
KDYDVFASIVRDHFPDVPEHKLSHEQRSQLTPPHYAFLKIAEGCDNTCNFCSIPSFRGKHQSRSMDDLVQQAQVLNERGVKEINVISQHLDYYGVDLNGEYQLPTLVRKLSAAAPDSWIRLHYCYPNDFTDELIAAMADCDNVARYVDMPIQHASDRTLALMGRKCTRKHIEQRLDAIRSAMPDVSIRSSFIVGFPGEREQDFEDLLDFMRCQSFDQVGCFRYSDEDGTTAAKMPEKISDELIAERWDTFMEQQQGLHHNQLQRWVGQELQVLVDEQLDFGSFSCRHSGQASEVDNVTLLQTDGLQIGDWANVRITGIQDYDLIAELCGS